MGDSAHASKFHNKYETESTQIRHRVKILYYKASYEKNRASLPRPLTGVTGRDPRTLVGLEYLHAHISGQTNSY